jgi:hypothetical protein
VAAGDLEERGANRAREKKAGVVGEMNRDGFRAYKRAPHGAVAAGQPLNAHARGESGVSCWGRLGRARGGGGGGPAARGWTAPRRRAGPRAGQPAQERGRREGAAGEGGTRQMGRQRGKRQPKRERGEREGKRKGFFPILIYFLKACFYKYNPQTK